MKKKGLVYFFDTLVGEVKETLDADFIFQYNHAYLQSINAKAISYSLPLQREAFSSQYLKGFFDGLLPEGWTLNLAMDYWKYHPLKDRYQLLLKACFDPIGAVSIRLEGINLPEKKEIEIPLTIKTSQPDNNLKKCLYCYEKLKEGSFHLKCSQDFFGSAKPPQISLSDETLKELGELSLNSGLTVPGFQKKLALNYVKKSKEHRLTLTHFAGKYILKPKGSIPHIPENEDLVIKLAKSYGLSVPKTAMIVLDNGDYALLSQRVDRLEDGSKLHMEDFCQILDQITDKKYVGSYQKVGKTLLDYCATNAPKEQILRLFELIIFSYLVGNADLHLKNLSILHNPYPSLAPAYDLLSFEIFQEDFKELDNDLMALAINGKKNKLNKSDFDSLAENFDIKPKVRDYIYSKFQKQLPSWFKLIEKSFLVNRKKKLLKELIQKRSEIIGIFQTD